MGSECMLMAAAEGVRGLRYACLDVGLHVRLARPACVPRAGIMHVGAVLSTSAHLLLQHKLVASDPSLQHMHATSLG
jgi:hypothetical protein